MAVAGARSGASRAAPDRPPPPPRPLSPGPGPPHGGLPHGGLPRRRGEPRAREKGPRARPPPRAGPPGAPAAAPMRLGPGSHLRTPPAAPTRPQDKAQVLADVRSIISEQLGTELDKVRGAGAATPPGARARAAWKRAQRWAGARSRRPLPPRAPPACVARRSISGRTPPPPPPPPARPRSPLPLARVRRSPPTPSSWTWALTPSTP
jgi:hypothetical protein